MMDEFKSAHNALFIQLYLCLGINEEWSLDAFCHWPTHCTCTTVWVEECHQGNGL